MSDRPRIVLALSPIAERQVEPLLFGEEALLEPVASASEADELERLSREHDASAVLLSPSLSGVTQGHVERVRASGLRVIGVALDEREEHALTALAVDRVIAADAAPEELLTLIHAEPRPTAAKPPPRRERANEDGAGTVLAVIGSKGAPGASECAASLAALAAERWPVLLVELDMLGGGLDVRIGADSHDGSVLGVIRAAGSAEALGELIERWTANASGWPPTLVAPADTGTALEELSRPGAVADTLLALRAHAGLTICDVGFLLGEGGREISPAARVHREALVSADAVLLVIGAREAQQRNALIQLDLLLGPLGIGPERLRIAVNGTGGPGTATRSELVGTLSRCLAERGLSADAWLHWDSRALSRAQRTGRPLASAYRRGRYAKTLKTLLDDLFLAGGPQVRTRKQTLPAPTVMRASAERRDEEVSLPWQR
jgi:hypothetical protein